MCETNFVRKVPRDFQNCLACSQIILEVIPENATVFFKDEAIIYWVESNKTCVTAQRLTPVHFTKGLYIAIRRPYGVRHLPTSTVMVLLSQSHRTVTTTY